MSDEDKIRELLNFSGFPFQHYCAEKISRLDGFQISAEVPFTHPGTNGPLLGVHGAIDLIAARPDVSNDLLICFIVECKKANDKIKNWILLPNRQQKPRWPTFCYTVQETNESLQLGVTRSVTFPKLGYARTDDFDFCINGIEANTKLTTPNRDQSEKFYNPLRQAAHGVRAFEAKSPKIIEGIDYLRRGQYQYGTNVYVPVVITTANIYAADVSIDLVMQGEIPPGALSLSSPKKWITVEFPLPDYLGYEIKREEGAVSVGKRTIFIVNDKAIDEFFTGATEVVNLMGVPSA